METKIEFDGDLELNSLADKGNIEANFKIGNHYRFHTLNNHNLLNDQDQSFNPYDKMAFHHYDLAAKGHHFKAQKAQIELCLAYGKYANILLYLKLIHLRKCPEQGEERDTILYCRRLLGDIHSAGKIVDQNIVQAEKYYKAAIKEGDKLAIGLLTVLYCSKLTTHFSETTNYYSYLIQNYASEFELNQFKDAVQNGLDTLVSLSCAGDKNASYILGNWYDQTINGLVKLDVQMAIKYYTLSINQGNTLAMVALGAIYEMLENFETAQNYYKLAVKNGCSEGERKLFQINVTMNNNLERFIHTNQLNEAKKILSFGIFPNDCHLLTAVGCGNIEMIGLLLRFGANKTSVSLFEFNPLLCLPYFLDRGWMSMHAYFTEVLFLLMNTNMELPLEIADLIVASMINANHFLSVGEFKKSTYSARANIKQKEESDSRNTITAIRDQYKKLVAQSYFFTPSNFPKEPNLDNIISHAFSGGTRTMLAFKYLYYIDTDGELTDFAPTAFKKVFEEYLNKKPISGLELPRLITKMQLGVAWGDQDGVKKQLRRSLKPMLERAAFTDCSGRHFSNISAFEYMLWALDTRYMVNMLLDCLPNDETGRELVKELKAQYEHVNIHGVTYTLEGKEITEKHFDGSIIINVLQIYIDNYSQLSATECKEFWCIAVGMEQCYLPAHIIQHYCDGNIKFRSDSFTKKTFERSLKFYIEIDNGTQKEMSWSGSSITEDLLLGVKFGLIRGSSPYCSGRGWANKGKRSLTHPDEVEYDLSALTALFKIRIEDFNLLQSRLDSLCQNLDESTYTNNMSS